MKIYLDECGVKRLIGRADIENDHIEPYLDVPLFGVTSIIFERFALGLVTNIGADGSVKVER